MLSEESKIGHHLLIKVDINNPALPEIALRACRECVKQRNMRNPDDYDQYNPHENFGDGERVVDLFTGISGTIVGPEYPNHHEQKLEIVERNQKGEDEVNEIGFYDWEDYYLMADEDWVKNGESTLRDLLSEAMGWYKDFLKNEIIALREELKPRSDVKLDDNQRTNFNQQIEEYSRLIGSYPSSFEII